MASKAGEEPRDRTPEELAGFGAVLGHATVRGYLTGCVVSRDYFASGVRVLGDASLTSGNLLDASPGRFVYPHGYLVIATSIGGNAICLDCRDGHVAWAAHDSFFDDLISFKDEQGRWVDLTGHSRESVSRAMRHIETDAEKFLKELLEDRLIGVLDALDLG